MTANDTNARGNYWAVILDGQMSENDFSVGRPHLGRPELGGGRPLPPKPSSAQHWYTIGISNPVLADMLKHYGQQVDWYNLYKSFEGVRRLSGGERKLVTKSWAPSASELRRFKQTADYYHRHAYDPTRSPPKNPMALTNAATMIDGMVRAVLRELT